MWIKVVDEYPPDDVPVLVYGVNESDPDQRLSIASYRRSHIVTHYGRNNELQYAKPFHTEARWLPLCAVGGYDWQLDLEVTHWAQLPESPVLDGT